MWGRDDFTKITLHIIGRGANIPGYPQPLPTPQPPPLPLYADQQTPTLHSQIDYLWGKEGVTLSVYKIYC